MKTITKAQYWSRVQGIRNIQEARKILRPLPEVTGYMVAIVHKPVRPDYMRVSI